MSDPAEVARTLRPIAFGGRRAPARARSRSAARRPPRQPALPDRLHRHQRPRPGADGGGRRCGEDRRQGGWLRACGPAGGGAGTPLLPHRLPLRHPVRRPGSRAVRAAHRPARPARGRHGRAGRAAGWPPRLRRGRPHRSSSTCVCASCCRRRGSSSPAGAWSRSCARSRNRRRSRASEPPRSSRTRRCAASWKRGSPGAPSGRSQSSSSCVCAAWAPLLRASPRSSPPAPTPPCPTPSRVTSGSRATRCVTIDWGALHDGYCSDCTRTYATGEHLPDEARAVYELVLAAQLAGLAAMRAGPNGKAIDGAARGGDRGRRPRRSLRPRPRPRRGPRGPRGPPPLAHRGRAAAARRVCRDR